jgi:hypothetical protein
VDAAGGRVAWPLLSQKVRLPVSQGSSGAGWTWPWVSIARDVTACSPGAGVPQSSDQRRQA